MNVTVDVVKKEYRVAAHRNERRVDHLGLDRSQQGPRILKGETSKLLTEQRKVGKEQVDKAMMAAWDCRISQVVDVNKGIHCFTAKGTSVPRKIEALPDKENKTYLVTVGKDADLNKAMDDASWAMVELLRVRRN
jgi:acetamidase/formamidase